MASLSPSHYDVAILGTGLTQSILAAALAKAGRSVLHLDQQDYYGEQWASLTLSDLVRWARSSRTTSSRSHRISHLSLSFPARDSSIPVSRPTGDDESNDELPEVLRPLDRHYALSLCPALLPASGATIDNLVRSRVAHYCTFRLLEAAALYSPHNNRSIAVNAGADLLRVPSSKEDVFKNRELGLADKRKLMKFLMFAAGDYQNDEKAFQGNKTAPFRPWLAQHFSLSDQLTDAVTYAVALCSSAQEPTATALARARTHLRSVGRYGNSAYLIGQYGGAGEIAQGFCRCCAVYGGTYVLAHRILSAKPLEHSEDHSNSSSDSQVDSIDGDSPSSPRTPPASARWQLEIEGIDNCVSADWLVGSDVSLDELGLPTDPRLLAREAPTSAGEDFVRGVLVLDRPIPLAETLASTSATASTSTDGSEEASNAQPAPSPPETGLIVFPPGSLPLSDSADDLAGEDEGDKEATRTNEMAISALMMGEGTFSCPKGQYVYYITTHCPTCSTQSAKSILQPAIDALLNLVKRSKAEWPREKPAEAGIGGGEQKVVPLLELYYRQSIPSWDGHGARSDEEDEVEKEEDQTDAQRHLVHVTFPPPSLQPTSSSSSTSTSASSGATRTLPSLASPLDDASVYAESLFWTILGSKAQSAAERVAERRRKRRAPAEYVGRGGVGPQEEEDEDEGQEEEEDEGEGEGGQEGEGRAKTVSPVEFFKPEEDSDQE